jgi:hypothetical protein
MTGRPYEKLNEYGGKADSLVRKSIVNLASVSGNRLGRKYTSGLQLCEHVSKDVWLRVLRHHPGNHQMYGSRLASDPLR